MSTIEAKVDALKKSKAEEFATACPSRVIEMALEDLEAVEQSPNYRVVMEECHRPSQFGYCTVCLGGAVIANRLGGSPSQKLLFDSYEDGGWGDEECARLSALDCFRQGLVGAALDYFGIGNAPLGDRAPITPYHLNPDSFKLSLRHLIVMLKRGGL